jgi:hypothetical protein
MACRHDRNTLTTCPAHTPPSPITYTSPSALVSPGLASFGGPCFPCRGVGELVAELACHCCNYSLQFSPCRGDKPALQPSLCPWTAHHSTAPYYKQNLVSGAILTPYISIQNMLPRAVHTNSHSLPHVNQNAGTLVDILVRTQKTSILVLSSSSITSKQDASLNNYVKSR